MKIAHKLLRAALLTLECRPSHSKQQRAIAVSVSCLLWGEFFETWKIKIQSASRRDSHHTSFKLGETLQYSHYKTASVIGSTCIYLWTTLAFDRRLLAYGESCCIITEDTTNANHYSHQVFLWLLFVVPEIYVLCFQVTMEEWWWFVALPMCGIPGCVRFFRRHAAFLFCSSHFRYMERGINLWSWLYTIDDDSRWTGKFPSGCRGCCRNTCCPVYCGDLFFDYTGPFV